MNIQRKNSAHHFRMQSEREQTLVSCSLVVMLINSCCYSYLLCYFELTDSSTNKYTVKYDR